MGRDNKPSLSCSAFWQVLARAAPGVTIRYGGEFSAGWPAAFRATTVRRRGCWSTAMPPLSGCSVSPWIRKNPGGNRPPAAIPSLVLTPYAMITPASSTPRRSRSAGSRQSSRMTAGMKNEPGGPWRGGDALPSLRSWTGRSPRSMADGFPPGVSLMAWPTRKTSKRPPRPGRTSRRRRPMPRSPGISRGSRARRRAAPSWSGREVPLVRWCIGATRGMTAPSTRGVDASTHSCALTRGCRNSGSRRHGASSAKRSPPFPCGVTPRPSGGFSVPPNRDGVNSSRPASPRRCQGSQKKASGKRRVPGVAEDRAATGVTIHLSIRWIAVAIAPATPVGGTGAASVAHPATDVAAARAIDPSVRTGDHPGGPTMARFRAVRLPAGGAHRLFCLCLSSFRRCSRRLNRTTPRVLPRAWAGGSRPMLRARQGDV